MKTILCPVDFSPNSANAVRFAVALNRKLKARILLLHAYDTPALYSDPAFFTGAFTESAIHQSELKRLKSFRQRIFGNRQNPKVELILVQGLASARISEVARKKKADLIVMGATGTGGGERLFAGSNAARVMRQAPCMVLLIPHHGKFADMDKIVYATDLTPDNLDHAKKITPFAKLLKAKLLFLYVDREELSDRAAMEKVDNQIRKQKSNLFASGHVIHGTSVARGIDKFLSFHRAGCLAIYTRHRSVLQAIYHPSLSRTLSLHASVPLLVVHESDRKTRN